MSFVAIDLILLSAFNQIMSTTKLKIFFSDLWYYYHLFV